MAEAHTTVPALRTARTTRRPLVAVCLGFFVVMLDTTIVNVALGDMGSDLHAGITVLQWVVAGYSLVFGALLLSVGALADRIGPRALFLAGLLAFAVTSGACAAAPDGATLVTARLFQGLAAAMLVPTSLSLITSAYPDRAQRARAIGVWGGMGGVAAAAGPALGGLLIAGGGWRLVFLVNVPVCAVTFFLVRAWVTATPGVRGRRLDPAGQMTVIAALGLLSYALIDSSNGWTAPDTAAAVAGVALLAAFAVLELRAAQPMFPVRLFRRPLFSSAIVTGLLLNFGFYGQLFVQSLYFQKLQGHSALAAGLLLVPQTATAIAGSTWGGRVNARTGPRVPILIGLTVGALGFLGLWTAGANTRYALVVVPMIAVGFGTAFTMPAATAAAIDAAPADRAGAASGAFNAARQTGGVLGVAVLGGAIAGRDFVPGYHLAVTLAAAGFLTAAALTAVATRHRGASPQDPAATRPYGHRGRR